MFTLVILLAASRKQINYKIWRYSYFKHENNKFKLKINNYLLSYTSSCQNEAVLMTELELW